MKNIKNYHAEKYDTEQYKLEEEGIYKYISENLYVTSLMFEQEPEYDEGDNASFISQYPLEDILDKFNCFVSDFYDELNVESSTTCYQEFASSNIEDIRNLRSIVGKHVYNKNIDESVKLIIE